MNHPLVILACILVGMLGAFLLGAWLLGRIRNRLHLLGLDEFGRVIAWDATIRYLRDQNYAIVVFDAMTGRVWLLEGDAAAHFIEGYDNGVASVELARLLETIGHRIHPLPCKATGPLVERKMSHEQLQHHFVFLDSNAVRGMVGLWNRFSPREKRHRQ